MPNSNDTPTDQYEPVYHEGETKYLHIFKKQTIPAVDGRTIEETTKNPIEPETTTITDLKPDGLWKCLKCEAEIQSNPKQPLECYDAQGGCGRTGSFKPILLPINPDLWQLPIYKKIDFEPCDMILIYEDIIDTMKKLVVFTNEIQYKLFTLWNISTWKTGLWDSVGFLVFTGGIDCGKTLCLDVIREIGFRMLHSSGVSFPAMIRATHNHQAGVLIDEAHNKLDYRTEAGRDFIDFIKPSYRKGSKYIVAHKEDQYGIISYNNFGFKAFAGEQKLVDRALLSRSIIFVMEQSKPPMAKLKYVQKDLDEIKNKLLHYRYYTNDPEDLGQEFELDGRIREIFESIIATGRHIGVDTTDIIEYAKSLKIEQDEDLKNTLEYEVLQAMWDLSTTMTLDDAPETISYRDITKQIYGDDLSGDERRKFGQKIGYNISRKLQLKHKHGRDGNVILMNEKKNLRRLDYLYHRFGIK